MWMNDDEMVRQVRESFKTMTSEEANEIIEEMIRDGVLDRDGKVLLSARVPDGLPDWARPANGHATTTEPKKPKRVRSKK